MPRVLGVIPARYASSRFPGKALAPLGSRLLVEEVWRRARRCDAIETLILATDDERIAEAGRRFGAEVAMTSADHVSGTDRVAEVALSRGRGYELVLNIQGDEPLLTPTSLERLVAAFEGHPEVSIATLAEPLDDPEAWLDPNVVKVVTGLDGRALYFSRAPVPFPCGARSAGAGALRSAFRERAGSGIFRKHQGVYAYRLESLLALTRLPPSPLEREEGLEQLRALQAGFRIQVVESDYRSVGVDTPADLHRAAERLGARDG